MLGDFRIQILVPDAAACLMDNTDTQFSGISLQHLIGIIELTIHAVGNIVRKSADKCIGQMLFYTIPSDL